MFRSLEEATAEIGSDQVEGLRNIQSQTANRKNKSRGAIMEFWMQEPPAHLASLHIDAMSDHALRAVAKVAPKYTIAEANEQLGRLAMQRLRSHRPGRAADRKVTTADWQELARLDASAGETDQILPPGPQDLVAYGVADWPTLLEAGGPTGDREPADSEHSHKRRHRAKSAMTSAIEHFQGAGGARGSADVDGAAAAEGTGSGAQGAGNGGTESANDADVMGQDAGAGGRERDEPKEDEPIADEPEEDETEEGEPGEEEPEAEGAEGDRDEEGDGDAEYAEAGDGESAGRGAKRRKLDRG